MKKTTDVEKQLLPRLKILSFILLFCSLAALAWDFLPAEEDALDAFLLEMEEAAPPMNTHLVAGSFATVGALSLIIYWRKKKSLSQQIPPE